MLLAVGLAVLAALSILLLPRGPAARPLDPDSTASSGARAFAQVLQRHGVELQAVRTGDELRAAHLDGDTTLVVANAGDLSHSDLSFVREQRAVSRLVLLDPTDPVLDGLQVPATAVSRGGRLTAGCTTDIADPQDTMSTGAILYRATGGSGDARRPTTSCFGDDDDAIARVLTDAAVNDMRTWLRLPAETPLSGLAQAVHRATGEDPDEVLALLSRPASTTSASTPSLADHAARLRRLRRKVRTS